MIQCAKIINILSFFTVLLFFVQNSFLQIEIGNFYYVGMGIILFTLLGLDLFQGKSFSIEPLVVGIALAALLSILFNNIPAYFKSSQRFIIFFLLILLLSPMLKSSTLSLYRNQLFYFIVRFVFIAVCISALGLLIKFPLFFGRSGFMGLFNHSMFMGPMAAVATIYSIYLVGIKDKGIKKIWYILMTFLCFLAMIGAGSRGALAGGIIGILFFMYKINSKGIFSYIKKIFFMIILLIVTLPLWIVQAEFMVNKMIYAEVQGSVTATRDELWEQRIKEFQSSKLFGIGFASVSEDSKFDKETGTIEPGSSWLVVFSMTGLLGGVGMILLFMKKQVKLLGKKIEKEQGALFGGIFLFFIFHMFVEGYIYSAGSGLFFFVWMLLGVEAKNIKK